MPVSSAQAGTHRDRLVLASNAIVTCVARSNHFRRPSVNGWTYSGLQLGKQLDS